MVLHRIDAKAGLLVRLNANVLEQEPLGLRVALHDVANQLGADPFALAVRRQVSVVPGLQFGRVQIRIRHIILVVLTILPSCLQLFLTASNARS